METGLGQPVFPLFMLGRVNILPATNRENIAIPASSLTFIF